MLDRQRRSVAAAQKKVLVKNMFDVSKDQLGLLNDSDLRELVARLCEAELGLAGDSVKRREMGRCPNCC